MRMKSSKDQYRSFVVYLEDRPVALVTARSRTQAVAMIYGTLETQVPDLDHYIEQGWPSKEDVVEADTSVYGGIVL